MKRNFVIYSHVHSGAVEGNRWWGPGAKGYFNLDGAGRFTRAEALKVSNHTIDEVVQLGSSRFLTLIRGDAVDLVVWKYTNLLANARAEVLEEVAARKAGKDGEEKKDPHRGCQDGQRTAEF